MIGRSDRPGIRRASELRTREQELEEELEALRRARQEAQEAESETDRDPLAPERRMFHAAFKAVVDELRQMGWADTRTGRFFKLSKTTIFELYNEGFRRRKQLQGHVAVRAAMLPERAYRVWKQHEDSWRSEALRTGTYG